MSDHPRPSFTRAELEAHRGETVPDLVGEEVRLLVVGINPGLWTAATQTHFSHPTNRFYPALHLAGITRREIDAAAGMTAEQAAHLTGRGVAITNVVARATASASELSTGELRGGGERLRERVAEWGPAVVAVAGLGAYRTALGSRDAEAGRQPDRLEGAEVWAVPNPSGLNAHETTESLARWYRQPAEAAGIELDPPRW